MSNDAQQSIDQGQNPFNDTQKVEHTPPRLINEVQRLLAELLGTFALTMVSAGGLLISTISHGEISPAVHLCLGVPTPKPKPDNIRVDDTGQSLRQPNVLRSLNLNHCTKGETEIWILKT